MSRIILIFEDSLAAKRLAAEMRKELNCKVQLRNPALWDAAESLARDPAHGIIVPMGATNGEAIVAAYAADGVAVHRKLTAFDLDVALAEAAAGKVDLENSHADQVEIPEDWADLHWTKKVKLAKEINPAFEPDDESPGASAGAFIEAELARRNAAADDSQEDENGEGDGSQPDENPDAGNEDPNPADEAGAGETDPETENDEPGEDDETDPADED